MMKPLMLMIGLTSGSLAFGQGFYSSWWWDDSSFIGYTDLTGYPGPPGGSPSPSMTAIYSNLAGAYIGEGTPADIQQSTYLDDRGDQVLWEYGFDYIFEDTLANCLSGRASYQFWLNVRKTAYSFFRDEQVSCGGGCVAKQCDYVVGCDAFTTATCGTSGYTIPCKSQSASRYAVPGRKGILLFWRYELFRAFCSY